MNTTISFSIEAQRKLFLKKDLIELSYWIDELEAIDKEINTITNLEKLILNNPILRDNLKVFRRKNTLSMGLFCQYEKDLRTDFEYGKTVYDVTRAKLHEKKRNEYQLIIKDFRILKEKMYKLLLSFERK